MSDTATKLLTVVLGLSPDERFQLAQQLLDSLEEDDLLPDDPAFQAELNERLEEVSKGTAKLVPWEEARENLRAELQRRSAAVAANGTAELIDGDQVFREANDRLRRRRQS